MKKKYLAVPVLAGLSMVFLSACGTEPQGVAGVDRPFVIGITQQV